ncbi:MAG: ParA family protein [Actinomycetes bacterium]|jgi:hypothetical protein|nr:ParA family protein [Actinomycetes bacterium]
MLDFQFTIITGHYGVGKTNLALNLARDAALSGRGQVMLVDLDIVNPYFRSSDYPQLLDDYGIRLVAPTFARTTLESPSLPAAVSAAFDHAGPVFFDVGGDDDGATTLGRYRNEIQTRAATLRENPNGYAFLYVVNRYRNLSTTPTEAVLLLREIEAACGLTATGIVNNSHLQIETTLDVVAAAADFGVAVARLARLPLVATTLPAALMDAAATDTRLAQAPGGAATLGELLPIQTLVTTPWS